MMSSVASRPRKKSSRNESEEDEEDDTGDEDSTSDEEENASDEDDNNDDDAGTVDNLFEELLSKQSVHAYPCLEDFDLIVKMYERKSGNHLGITHSERSIY